MSGIFQMDSPFMRELEKFSNMVILSVLWLVCCLPVITIGASTTALYYATMKDIRGVGRAAGNFFSSFRANLKQSVIAELILSLPLLLFLLDVFILSDYKPKGAELVQILLPVLAFLYGMVLCYIFPVLSRFRCSTWELFKNAFLLGIMSLPTAFLILLVNAVPLLIAMWSMTIFFRLIPVFLLVWPGIAARINSHMFMRVFRKKVNGELPEESETDSEEA